jgi:tRNA nucleotidyltransferase (CCA-adding enzyme)
VELHVYDHHPPGPDDLRGAVDVSRPVGANVTVMLHVLAERGVPLRPEEATLCLLGLYQETGCLTYAGTTPEDAEAAASCLRAGANLEIVARFLPRELGAEQVAVLDDLLRSAVPVDVHGVTVHVGQASSDAYAEGLGDVASRAAAILSARALFASCASGPDLRRGPGQGPAVDCRCILGRLGRRAPRGRRGHGEGRHADRGPRPADRGPAREGRPRGAGP